MGAFVGLCVMDVAIPDSRSLKEKRQVIRSLLDRVRSRFNIAACEADHLDEWQRATLAFSCVANNKGFVHETLMRVAELVESDGRVVVEGISMEIW